MTPRSHKRFQLWSLCLLICWIGLSSGYAQQIGVAGEYDLKAAMVFRFVAFVEWPEQAFETPDAPFVIGVYGTDPFGTALESSVEGQSIGERQFEVRPWAADGDDGPLHVVFIPRGETLPEPERNRLRDVPVLIVSEAEDPSLRGIINLVIEDNRVRFEISRQAADRAGLRLGSRLLGLARIVDE